MERLSDRRATLDPALTMLALRGRRAPDGFVPFPVLDRAVRVPRWRRLGARLLAACRSVRDRSPFRD